MVKIRLARFGRKNLPFYRIVAIPAKTKREGEAIEYLGTYNPKSKPSEIKLKVDRVKYWLSVGAQPTDTVNGLLAKEGLVKPLKKKYAKKPGKKRQAELDAMETKKEEEKKAKEEAKQTEAPAEAAVESQTETAEAATEETPAETSEKAE